MQPVPEKVEGILDLKTRVCAGTTPLSSYYVHVAISGIGGIVSQVSNLGRGRTNPFQRISLIRTEQSRAVTATVCRRDRSDRAILQRRPYDSRPRP